MADLILSFTIDLNTSLQIGDVVHYCNPSSVGGFDTADSSGIKYLGEVTAITHGSPSTITCDFDPATATPLPTESSFILFSKDNSVNTSSITGYYGVASFNNTSNVKGELFAVACEAFVSSK